MKLEQKRPKGNKFIIILKEKTKPSSPNVYLHATKETKNYLDVIDPVDEEVGHEADAAGGRRDRDFLVQRSRFLAALKTRLGLILAKAVAMRVMINATGCPAPVLDRNRMNTHKHLSQLIELAIDHDIPTPV